MTIATWELGLVLAIIELIFAVTGIAFAAHYTDTKRTQSLVISIVSILLFVLLFFPMVHAISTIQHNMA